jgi:hypothetical protein
MVKHSQKNTKLTQKHVSLHTFLRINLPLTTDDAKVSCWRTHSAEPAPHSAALQQHKIYCSEFDHSLTTGCNKICLLQLFVWSKLQQEIYCSEFDHSAIELKKSCCSCVLCVWSKRGILGLERVKSHFWPGWPFIGIQLRRTSKVNCGQIRLFLRRLAPSRDFPANTDPATASHV